MLGFAPLGRLALGEIPAAFYVAAIVTITEIAAVRSGAYSLMELTPQQVMDSGANVSIIQIVA